MFGNESDYKTVRYEKGDVIFKQGDTSRKLCIVKSGEVACVTMNQDRVVPVHNIQSAGVLAEDSVFSEDRPCSYSAVAMSAVAVLEIPKRELMRYIEANSKWMKNILFDISEKISNTTDVISEHKIIDDRFSGGQALSGEDEKLIKASLAESK